MTIQKNTFSFKMADVMSLRDLAYTDGGLVEASKALTARACDMIPQIGNMVEWKNDIDYSVLEDVDIDKLLASTNKVDIPQEAVDELKSGYLLRYLTNYNQKHVLSLGNGKEKVLETKQIMAFTKANIIAMGKIEHKDYMDGIKAVRKHVQTILSDNYGKLVKRCYEYRKIALLQKIADAKKVSVSDYKLRGRSETLIMNDRIPKVLDDLYDKAKKENSVNKNINLDAMKKVIAKAKIDLAKCISYNKE